MEAHAAPIVKLLVLSSEATNCQSVASLSAFADRAGIRA